MSTSYTRFWVQFDVDELSTLSGGPPVGVRAGCGVTARSAAEAKELIREKVFAGQELPAITQWITDVDVATLDPRHVLPNVGDMREPGIWFPQGYA
jgi:hypothetical protein